MNTSQTKIEFDPNSVTIVRLSGDQLAKFMERMNRPVLSEVVWGLFHDGELIAITDSPTGCENAKSIE